MRKLAPQGLCPRPGGLSAHYTSGQILFFVAANIKKKKKKSSLELTINRFLPLKWAAGVKTKELLAAKLSWKYQRQPMRTARTHNVISYCQMTHRVCFSVESTSGSWTWRSLRGLSLCVKLVFSRLPAELNGTKLSCWVESDERRGSQSAVDPSLTLPLIKNQTE